MSEPRELTEIERAVVQMLAKPQGMLCDDLRADFLVRAFGDPKDLILAVFSSVDWGAINEHMEQHA
jgi:hypothetical protein